MLLQEVTQSPYILSPKKRGGNWNMKFNFYQIHQFLILGRIGSQFWSVMR